MLAAELTAWMQMLALHDHDARRWEPKRLRLRLFTVPAALARTGRRVLLHLAEQSTLGPSSSPTPCTSSASSPSPADHPQPCPTRISTTPAVEPVPRDDIG